MDVRLFKNKNEANAFYIDKKIYVRNAVEYGLKDSEKLLVSRITNFGSASDGRLMVNTVECLLNYDNPTKARFMLINANDIIIQENETKDDLQKELNDYNNSINTLTKEYEKNVKAISDKIETCNQKLQFMKDNNLTEIKGTEYRTKKIIEILKTCKNDKERLVYIDNIINGRNQYE